MGTYFKKWLINEEFLLENEAITMDNAPYHSAKLTFPK